MNKQELIESIAHLPSDCSGPRPMIDKLTALELIKLLDEPQKPAVPQFVADWIKYCKNTNVTMTRALLVGEVDFYNYANQKDLPRLTDFFSDGKNQETFAHAWLDGYEVEKEKRYLVKIIGITNYNSYLNYHKREDKWTIESRAETDAIRTEHTRKELEEASFGWVFDCPGIEIEEVTE